MRLYIQTLAFITQNDSLQTSVSTSEKNGNKYLQECPANWMRCWMGTHCSYSGRATNGQHDWVSMPPGWFKANCDKNFKAMLQLHTQSNSCRTRPGPKVRFPLHLCWKPLFLFLPPVGIQFPKQWLNLCPLQQKHRVVTTGLPGKSESPPISIPTIFEHKWLQLNSSQQSMFLACKCQTWYTYN